MNKANKAIYKLATMDQNEAAQAGARARERLFGWFRSLFQRGKV